MERLSLIVASVVLLSVLAGCSGSEAQATAEDEQRFKHPEKADFSKVPPDAFKPHGPAFIGEPSKGTMSGGETPPPLKH